MTRSAYWMIGLAMFVGTASSETKLSASHEKAIRSLIRITLRDAYEVPTFRRAFEDLISKDTKLSPLQKKEVLLTVQAKTSPKALEAVFLPVYARHFTASEASEIVRFFDSPAGKKFRAEDAQIRREIQEVGAAYGQQILTELAVRLQMPDLTRQPAQQSQ